MPSELLHKETFLWRRASPTPFWIQMSTAAVLVKGHGERHFSDVHGGDFFLLSQVHFGSSLYTTVYLESSSALPFLWCLRRRLKTAQQFLQPHWDVKDDGFATQQQPEFDRAWPRAAFPKQGQVRLVYWPELRFSITLSLLEKPPLKLQGTLLWAKRSLSVA